MIVASRRALARPIGDAVRRWVGTTPYMTGDERVSDADLVRRVLEGTSDAFTSLVDRHAAPCLRFATRMLGNREDAEDVTQETLMRAHRALHLYDPRLAFQTWLFSILVNRCRTALVQRERRLRRIVPEGDHPEPVVVADESERLTLRMEIARALDALPAEQREAFLLKHVEQLEYGEMAAITGQGISALKMRVQRACQRLRQELRELDDDR